MKKIVSLFLFFSILFFSCKKNDDLVVAEVYGNKLFLSELQELTPPNLTHEDSIYFVQQYIQQWSKEKIVLYEANRVLSVQERDFTQQLNEYREQLLMNAYYAKITKDSNLFKVSKKEILDYMEKSGMKSVIEKEIIKLNYVKFGLNSKLISPIKEIFFNEEKRINEKTRIEKLCADSIEYFIEDDKWFFLDEIETELPLQNINKTVLQTQNQYIETTDNRYHYLIVVLNYREKQTNDDISDVEYESVRSMLIQQKKNQFYEEKMKELYEKAKEKKKISQ